MPTAIDPNDVTIFTRTDSELEDFLIFAIVVAGKTAKTQARLLKGFYEIASNLLGHGFESPFYAIRALRQSGKLREALEASKLGQYARLEKCFGQLVDAGFDLRNCSCEELETIHGIKFKTSRFFVTHSRENADYAILDTHILKYMREMLGVDAPKATPSSLKQYQTLERAFLAHCRETGHTPANLDLQIWIRYSSREQNQS